MSQPRSEPEEYIQLGGLNDNDLDDEPPIAPSAPKPRTVPIPYELLKRNTGRKNVVRVHLLPIFLLY
jgi:hypothetical protein